MILNTRNSGGEERLESGGEETSLFPNRISSLDWGGNRGPKISTGQCNSERGGSLRGVFLGGTKKAGNCSTT